MTTKHKNLEKYRVSYMRRDEGGNVISQMEDVCVLEDAVDELLCSFWAKTKNKMDFFKAVCVSGNKRDYLVINFEPRK